MQDVTLDLTATAIEARIPVSLPFLLQVIRRRLMLYINEYGSGKVPEFLCSADILESEWREHRLIHISRRHGKRVFYGITGHARYRITEMDEEATKLLRIGELIGAGAKASFGMGYFNIREIS